MAAHSTKNQRTALRGPPAGSWVESGIPDRTERVAGLVWSAAFRVHRKLGAGFKESVYHRCLARALVTDRVAFVQQQPLSIEFEGLVIQDAGRPDFIVEDAVIVELKATEDGHGAHAAQVVNYLKASGLLVGLLIDFNRPYLRHGIQRFVHPDALARRVDRESQPS